MNAPNDEPGAIAMAVDNQADRQDQTDDRGNIHSCYAFLFRSPSERASRCDGPHARRGGGIRCLLCW